MWACAHIRAKAARVCAQTARRYVLPPQQPLRPAHLALGQLCGQRRLRPRMRSLGAIVFVYRQGKGGTALVSAVVCGRAETRLEPVPPPQTQRLLDERALLARQRRVPTRGWDANMMTNSWARSVVRESQPRYDQHGAHGGRPGAACHSRHVQSKRLRLRQSQATKTQSCSVVGRSVTAMACAIGAAGDETAQSPAIARRDTCCTNV